MNKLFVILTSLAIVFSLTSPVFAQTGDLNVGIAKSNYVRITSLPKLLGALIGVIFVVAFVIALFMLFWGGLQWIMSGGDAEGVEAAQKKIQAAIVGLVVIASVYALFSLVGAWLGFDITNLVIPDALDTAGGGGAAACATHNNNAAACAAAGCTYANTTGNCT